jgi:hypothetical protein
MNTDLLTEDLKKARSNNQSFWLMGARKIVVVALAHQSRRPGYWRERLSEKP